MTEAFADLARTAARAQGWPSLRLVVLPHPLEPRSPDEVRAIVHARLDEIVGLLAEGR